MMLLHVRHWSSLHTSYFERLNAQSLRAGAASYPIETPVPTYHLVVMLGRMHNFRDAYQQGM